MRGAFAASGSALACSLQIQEVNTYRETVSYLVQFKLYYALLWLLIRSNEYWTSDALWFNLRSSPRSWHCSCAG